MIPGIDGDDLTTTPQWIDAGLPAAAYETIGTKLVLLPYKGYPIAKVPKSIIVNLNAPTETGSLVNLLEAFVGSLDSVVNNAREVNGRGPFRLKVSLDPCPLENYHAGITCYFGMQVFTFPGAALVDTITSDVMVLAPGGSASATLSSHGTTANMTITEGGSLGNFVVDYGVTTLESPGACQLFLPIDGQFTTTLVTFGDFTFLSFVRFLDWAD